MFTKKIQLYIIVILGLITFSTKTFAQKNIQKADAYYDRSFFIEAIPFYEAEIKEGSDSKLKEKATERLANCYRIIGDFAKAEVLYKELVKKNKTNAEHQLHYALSLKASSKYAEASEEFKKYIALRPNDPMGKVYLESCRLAQIWLDEKLGNEVKHPDVFNTKHSEFATTFWKDGVLFTSSREDSKRPFIDFEGGNAEPKLDFYYVNLKKPIDSLKVEKFDNDHLNSVWHEGPAAFTPSGDTIYFTRTVKGVRDLKKNVRVKTLQLYVSHRNILGQWSPPKSAFSFNSTKYNCLHPSISPNDNFIVFSSDMPGGQGATDLYISYREGKNSWSAPVNLGSHINTFGNELYPYVYDEHTIYFSSDAHPGMGKMDIFKTEFKNGEWTEPENLKPPYNSIGDDFGFVMDRNTRQGFFSSDRFDSKGLDDIYAFSEFDPTIIIADGGTIKIPDHTIFDGLKFKVQDKETKHDTDMVSKNGYFSFIPDAGKTYTISIRKEGFSYNKIDLSLKRNSGENYLEWELKPSKKEIAVAGKLLAIPENSTDSIKTEKPVSSNYVLLKHSGNTLNQTATDINGSFKFKDILEPKKTYNLISSKKGKAIPYGLSGQVFSEKTPISEVELLLMKDGTVYLSTKSDNLGYYHFNDLVPANDYVVVAAKTGYLKSLNDITPEDFLNAENRVIYKAINLKVLTEELSHELIKNSSNENTITTKPDKSFELILKITEKGKPLNAIGVKVYENGNLLTETITNEEGLTGARHLDKTKSYTIISKNNEGVENIYQLDSNEYRTPLVTVLSKQIDYAGGKFNKPLIDKDLKKINKSGLYNTTDSLYYANHLKIVRGTITVGTEPVKLAEIKVFQNGLLIEKIKTTDDGNYYFDKLNSTFNYEFVISRKGSDDVKFDVFKEEIKNTKERDLVRNINLENGISITERNAKQNLEDLKMHVLGIGKSNEGITAKLFENGHLRAEIPLDKNNNIQFGSLDANKSYDVAISKGDKEFTMIPIPARSKFFTSGDTVDVSKGLNENGIISTKFDISSTGKGAGTLNKNEKPLPDAKYKLFVNGQLAEEGKTDANGKFLLTKLNPRFANTIEFVDKNGNIVIEDITEQDFKDLASGKKVYEFEDPELNHHNITQNNETKTSVNAYINETPLISEIEIYENGNLKEKLKPTAEGKIELPYLDPTKKYLAKTKSENHEYVTPINRNDIYSSKNPKINFLKNQAPQTPKSTPQPVVKATDKGMLGPPFPIEGKLINNGAPIAHTEVRVFENGNLKDIIETDDKGEYLLTGIDPTKNIKLEVFDKTGKKELILASSIDNTKAPVSNLVTDVAKSSLISNDNLEDGVNTELKNIVAEEAKVNADVKEKTQTPVKETSTVNKNFYEPNSLLKGNVTFNGLPTQGTTVILKKDGKVIAEKISNSDGNYSFEMIKEQGNYEIEFSKEGFNNETQKITPENFKNGTSQNTLQSLNLKNAIIYKGNVSNDGKNVSDAVVSLTLNNRVIGKGVADKNGQFTFQLEQGKEYGVKAASKDFFNSEAYITTHDKKANTTTEGNIKMNSIEINKTIRLDNIYYDFNSANIRVESLPELEKLADFMKLNPKVKIEIRAHTDTRGDEAYNMKLSIERAHNVMLFLMIEDVEKDRMIYRGYGETLPIITDAQTDEEHQYNRRTEFIVLEK